MAGREKDERKGGRDVILGAPPHSHKELSERKPEFSRVLSYHGLLHVTLPLKRDLLFKEFHKIWS
jgi:hypothetical protein